MQYCCWQRACICARMKYDLHWIYVQCNIGGNVLVFVLEGILSCIGFRLPYNVIVGNVLEVNQA